MSIDFGAVLEIALGHELLSRENAALCREEFPGGGDPVAWLLDRGMLSPDGAGRLRDALSRVSRDRETSEEYVRKGVLSPETAEQILDQQRQSISSEGIPTLLEVARKLDITLEAGPDDQTRLLSSGKEAVLILGRYEILEKIGSGGGGSVYRGVDRQLERIVAIKKVPEEGASRFLREAQATARLEHPHIVSIFDMGEEDGDCYLILQFIEGSDFALWLESNKPSPLEIAGILRQVAEGIEHAHRNSILHRDVKPENVLIDSKGCARVTDFGLARETDSDSRVTVSGAILGTPSYMAPEQARGDLPQVQVCSDIYSIGATLFYALTGKPPFAAKSLEELIRKVISHDPPRPIAINADVPRDLETICLKAMEKEPRRRYPTALELAEDLQRFERGEPILARPPSVIYQVQRWVWKRRAVLIAVASALLLAVAGGGGFTLYSRGRSFHDAKEASRLSYEQKEWSQAIAQGERALAVRPDAEISTMVRESRRKLAQKEAHERLSRDLRPFFEKLAVARSFLYDERIQFSKKLGPIQKEVSRWEGIMKEPLHAGFEEGWRALGLGWALLGNHQKAEEAFYRASSGDSEVNYHLGRINLYAAIAEGWKLPAGDTAKTARLMKKALVHLNQINEGWGAAREMELAIVRAHQALLDGNREKAVRLCKSGLARYGEDQGTEEFWIILAWTRQGGERIDAYTKAHKRKPHDPWVLYLRGSERAKNGDLSGAVVDLNAVVRLRPDFPDAYYYRGTCRAMLGDFDGALADYEKVPQLDPPLDQIYSNRAEVRYQAGDLAGAIEDFNRVVRLRPEDPNAFYDRALTWIKAEKYQKALDDLETALKLAPPSWKYREDAKTLRAQIKRHLSE